MNLQDENYIKILKDQIKQMKSLFTMHLSSESIQQNKTLVKLTKVIEKIGIDDAKLCELILKQESDFSDYQMLKENEIKKIAKILEEKKNFEEKCHTLEKELTEIKEENNNKNKETLTQQEKDLQQQEKYKEEVNSLKQQIKKQEMEKDYHKKQNLNYTSLIKQLQTQASDSQNSKDQMFGELSKQVKLMKNSLENCQNEYIQKLEKKEQEIKSLERKNLMLQKKLEMNEDFDLMTSIKKRSPKEGSNNIKKLNKNEVDSDNSVESFDMNEPKKQTPEKILKQITNKTQAKTQKLQGSVQTSAQKAKNKIKH